MTWDAVYFQRISEVGYEHEQTHAFFPLIPAATRRGVRLVRARGRDIEHRETRRELVLFAALPLRARVSALLIFNGAYVAAAVVLEPLGTLVLEGDNDDDDVHKVALGGGFVALNPASVFHSAPFYTESVFALASFAGFYFLERGARAFGTSASVWNRNGAALCFALACAARSNGALNSLVLAHDFFARVLPSVAFGPKQNKRRGKNAPGSRGKNASYVLPLFAATFAFAARCTTLAPLSALQLYGYRTYCARALERNARAVRPGALSQRVRARAEPLLNVGFLRTRRSRFQTPARRAGAAVSASAGRSWWTAFRVHTNARKRDENEPTRAGARRRRKPIEDSRLKRALKQKRNRDGPNATRGCSRVRPYLFKWAVMTVVALLACTCR